MSDASQSFVAPKKRPGWLWVLVGLVVLLVVGGGTFGVTMYVTATAGPASKKVTFELTGTGEVTTIRYTSGSGAGSGPKQEFEENGAQLPWSRTHDLTPGTDGLKFDFRASGKSLKLRVIVDEQVVKQIDASSSGQIDVYVHVPPS